MDFGCQSAYFSVSTLLSFDKHLACLECRKLCCQIRRTLHPAFFNILFTIWSRFLLRASFSLQNIGFVCGIDPWSGHPCQKQPSTKMHSLSLGKTKSGLPNNLELRRQPLIRCLLKSSTTMASVARLPELWTFAMMLLRLSREKTSGIVRYNAC